MPEPDRDAGPEEIADYVLVSIARRPRSHSPRRRWDDNSHAHMLELLKGLIAAGGAPLFGESVEHASEPVEHGGRSDQLVVGELGQGGPEPWFELGPARLDEIPPSFGERGEDHATVVVGAGAVDEVRVGESVEHFGDRGGAEIGVVGELGGR